MKWSDKEPDLKITPLSEGLYGASAIIALEILVNSSESPFIIFPNDVRQKIMKHLCSGNTELGGLLIGQVISQKSLSDGIIAIRIKDAILSTEFDATGVSLSMGTSVWSCARDYTDQNTFVIGWYHSHPNLGAFFSSTDRRTQEQFFNQEYSIGLVIDPIRNEDCWFLGSESKSIEPKFILEATK